MLMKRMITKLFMTAAAITGLFAVEAAAQTVLRLPDGRGSAMSAPSVKVSVKTGESGLSVNERLLPMADRALRNAYTQAEGTTPKHGALPMRSPNAPEDDTQYTYTGFNAAAGIAADGSTATGGMVNFNLGPFACDTVSSDAGLSPYSYVAKGKLYCFSFSYDNATNSYPTMTRTTYDANTLRRLDSKTVDVPDGGAKRRIPYILSYDDSRDVVYAISFADEGPEGKGSAYYLNILDTATCRLQCLGYLGSWIIDRDDKDQYNIKGFCAGYGTLYVQLLDDSLRIGKINPTTCETEIIGRTAMPTQYVYGLQPMLYDANSGNMLVSHYDFNNGTVYYKVLPFVAWGATQDTLKTELLEKAPTGYSYFYRRPETVSSYYTYTLAPVSDLAVSVSDDCATATVSLTVPDRLADGSEIEFPDWVQDYQKSVKCNVYIDNNYMTVEGLPTTIKFGDHITGTIDLQGGYINVGPGLHTFTVQLNSNYNEIDGGKASLNMMVGADVPEAPLNPSLVISDNSTATITWDAPEKGRYDDFGGVFDASNLTYDVVRNTDSTVVASGITETTATDNTLPEEIAMYSYTIYAYSNGNIGAGAVTNSVSAGIYQPLPYENTFGGSNCLDNWTIINSNDDGLYKTWTWNSYSRMLVTNWGEGDDWAITPPFRMKTGRLYELTYDVSGQGTLRTTMGREATPEGQSTLLATLTKIDETETVSYCVVPAEDGEYRFALHNYSVDENDVWRISHLAVREVASTEAPDSVTGAVFVPADGGALSGILRFTLPTKAIGGTALQSLTKVAAYDTNGNLLADKSGVAPGEEAELEVSATHGRNTWRIVATGESGDGRPVLVKAFAGPDAPAELNNVRAVWGEGNNTTVLSWDAPSKGKNGGYVDPAGCTYRIYKYDADTYSNILLGETTNSSETVTLLDNMDNQDQYVFSISAVNGEGESEPVKVGIVLGVPYDLPFEEPFAAEGLEYSPWLLMPIANGQNWTVDTGVFNEKVQPQNGDGLQLLLRNTGSTDGAARFVSPIIDFSGYTKPVALSLWLHHTEGLSPEAYVTIDASIDGGKEYIAVADTVRLGDNNGWQEHVFNLSSLIGHKAQLGLTGWLPDGAARIFADNMSIRVAEGRDLALTGISAPYHAKVGDTLDVAVTVVNNGEEAAEGYSVLLTVDGEVVADEMPETTLGVGEQTVLTFALPVTAANNGLTYSAEILYDGDDDETNNRSKEVTVDATQVDLPAPANLTIENGTLALAWDAPEIPDGRRVTLDFEDMPAFTIDNINGWTTVDGDGHLTTTFIQYYGNYWPYANQPLAWMTWSAVEAGCGSAALWTPYEGEKCLIAWGNYGVDADGRTNEEADDDWFISPEVKGGSELSFMTAAGDTGCEIEVLTSSTDNSPESFTNRLTTISYAAQGEWQKVAVTLPADAKHVAIHTVSNTFGIMIDNVEYTEAATPVLQRYNIYRGTELDGTSASASATGSKEGSYAVSAVYDLGESALSNVVTTTAIVSLPAGKATVSGGTGTITIEAAAGTQAEVFSVSGRKVAGGIVEGTATYRVGAGVYVVTLDGRSCKIVVR